jgi:hypothetical protein
MLSGPVIQAAGKSAQVTGGHEAGNCLVNGRAGIEIKELARVKYSFGRGVLRPARDPVCRAVVGLWPSHLGWLSSSIFV